MTVLFIIKHKNWSFLCFELIWMLLNMQFFPDMSQTLEGFSGDSWKTLESYLNVFEFGDFSDLRPTLKNLWEGSRKTPRKTSKQVF